jgi:hypothetical protein
MIGRTSLLLLRGLGYLVAGLAVLTGLAAWRLASGPITLTLLTPTLAQALDDAVRSAGDLRATVGETVVVWDGFEHPLALRLHDVRIAAADGETVATVPELGVGLSVPALIGGRLALARVVVVRPTLHLERTGDGRLVLDLNGPGHPGGGATLAVPGTGPATSGNPERGLAAALLAPLRRPADPTGPLGALAEVAVTGAALTVDDQIAGVTWSVPTADLTASRRADGLHAVAHLELRLPGGSATLDADAFDRQVPAEDPGGGGTTATLRFTGLDPAALSPAFPGRPELAGVHLALSGSLEAVFDHDLTPRRLTLSLLGAEGGTLDLPMVRAESVDVHALALAADLDPGRNRLVLRRARLELDDPVLTVTARGEASGLSGPPAGTLHLELAAGPNPDQTTPATLDAALVPAGAEAGGRATLTLHLAGLEPARLAGLAPRLAPLAAAAFPIGGTVEAALDTGWLPVGLTLALDTGPGALVLPPSLLPDPVPIRAISLRARVDRPLDPVPARLDLNTLALDFGGPHVAIDGTVIRTGARLAITGGVEAGAVPAGRLPRLWPVSVGKHARDWITANITAGTIDRGWLRVEGSAPTEAPDDILATTLNGGVEASDLTVGYFKTLPPIVGISGGGTSDGRSLTLHTTGGHVGDLAVGDTTIVISKLDTPQEWIDIDAPLSGSIRSALEVLDTPPLRYAHRVDIDPARTEGTQSCRLHFYFPLKKSIDIENVEIGARATLHGAAVAGIAGGLTVSDGDLRLALDGTGMDVTGTARLEGVPATVGWRENFRDAADPRTRVAIRGEITEADLSGRGLHLAPYAAGAAVADVQLLVDRARRTSLRGQLDLAPARLALPPLGWTKPAGTAGKARFVVEFDNGRPVRLTGLDLDAAGLKAGGSIDLTAGGGVGRVALGSFRLGATDLAAEIKVRAGGGYDIAVHGAGLDARPMLKGPDDGQEKQRRRAERLARHTQPPESGPPYDLSIRLDRLITADNHRGLTGVRAQLDSRGLGWDSADLSAQVAGDGDGSGAVALHYRPEGSQRRLTVTADDAGALLRALDLTGSVRGGRLTLSAAGEPGFPVHPVSGRMEIGPYRVVDAPLLARVLNALSVTGLIELLQGQGLGFSRFDSDFTADQDRITLNNLRTAGGALGLTLSGAVDLAAETLAVQGTIVPLYGLNRIVGMIPVLGDLLSGGAGQGVFAATYALSGTIDEPEVSVNPLAALAPGFLRNMLFLNDGKDSRPPPPGR